jgi:hypothetical protein
MEDQPMFELCFWGQVPVRYRRRHASFEEAVEAAERVLARLDNRAAHPAIVYGPGCGRDGVTVV